MDEPSPTNLPLGFPELTELGKRIEMLRIQRGMSKQHLARFAGTSRQQLWRVMTGKSEMSLALRGRLADALQVPSFQTSQHATTTTVSAATPTNFTATESTRVDARAPRATMDSDAGDLSSYLADASRIVRTLSSMPSGAQGLALKRRLLDAIEDLALDAGITLDAALFDLRRMVLSGEL